MLYASWMISSVALSALTLLRWTVPHLTVLELAAAATPVGLAASAWLCFLVSGMMSGLSYTAIGLTFGITLVLLALQCRALWQAKEVYVQWWKAQRLWYHVPCLLALTPLCAVGGFLFFTRYLMETPDGDLNAGGAVWSDLPIHMMFANSFLHGENREIRLTNLLSPVFAGAPLHYPFIPDFHMAAVAAGGGTMRVATWLTGSLQFVSFVVLAYALALRVTKHRLPAVLVPVLVVGAGGLGGIDIVHKLGWTGALRRDPYQDTAYVNGQVWWFGFLPHVFLPQRGATWAYPLALVVLILTMAATSVENSFMKKRKLLIAAASCAILMPLLQPHSFLFAGIVVGVFAITDQCRPSRHRCQDLLSWAIAGAVAVFGLFPQVQFFVSHIGNAQSQVNNFMDVRPLFGSVHEFLEKWWWGLGATMFLFFAACGVELLSMLASMATPATPQKEKVEGDDHARSSDATSRTPSVHSTGLRARASGAHDTTSSSSIEKETKQAREPSSPSALSSSSSSMEQPAGSHHMSILLGCLLSFAVGYGIRFQPWDRDNIKLLYLSVLLAHIFVAKLLTAPLTYCLSRGKVVLSALYVPFLLAVLVFLTFSGYIGLWREDYMRHTLVASYENDMAEWVRDNTQYDGVFVTPNEHRNPVAMISGRTQLLAWDGWMWSHGYDYFSRRQDNDYILNNFLQPRSREVSRLITKYNIRYIMANNARPPRGVRDGDRATLKYCDGRIKRIFAVGPYEIYEVQNKAQHCARAM